MRDVHTELGHLTTRAILGAVQSRSLSNLSSSRQSSNSRS
jgi:hypothetical protein